MINRVRTIDFLPEIFRTHSNRQFLNATLDVITDQPDFRRVEGFIGERYGYGVDSTDKYVEEPSRNRTNYQLDPSVVFLKTDTQKPQDFISYTGIVNSLKHEGAITNNHDRLFSSDFYSWDPFVNYDKIVNYSQYFWIPNGPDAVPITSNVVYTSGQYTVVDETNGYVFDELYGTNPSMPLLRGGTYTIVVPSGSEPFWIQTVPGTSASSAQRTISGVTNNGTTGGVITFVVPDISTEPLDILYYQNGSSSISGSTIQLLENNSANTIYVNEIIGRSSYTSPTGVTFTNGLKIRFFDNVVPESYANNEYYVQGVGESIQLLEVNKFLSPESNEQLYETQPDSSVIILSNVPVSPQYITVSRESRDFNAWTRANRWFHQSVIDTTTNVLGYVTSNENNTVTRAKRPIIEYRGNFKLFNAGTASIGGVNLIDTTTIDAFTSIEGKTQSQVGKIDGAFLSDGMRIVFSADTNPNVRNKIYLITYVPSVVPGDQDIINLVEDESITVSNLSQIFVIGGNGISQTGTSWWFDISANQWVAGQKKVYIQQYPLFDIFDAAGHSLSDNTYYSGSNFTGSKLFSYTPGTGPDDPVLGFPISYGTTASIGDIEFTVNLNSDTFTYARSVEEEFSSPVNIGFVHHYITETEVENLSGWVKAVEQSFQYQVFEFPIVENYTYSSSNVTVQIEFSGSNYAIGDKIKIPGNLLGGTSPQNDLTFIISGVSGSGISSIDATSLSGIFNGDFAIFENCTAESITGSGSSALFTVYVASAGTTTYKCDVAAKSSYDTAWNPVVVYSGENTLDRTSYSVTTSINENTTTVTIPTVIGTNTTILIISDDVSKTAYYQVPNNLENNPFNGNITTIAVGDIRKQFSSIFANAPAITGEVFGNNNYNDLGNINKYGTSIIQNSASLVLPGLFLRKQNVNMFNALQYASEQYQNYKSLIINTAIEVDYSIYAKPSDILDDIIYRISKTKDSTSAFFWTDMFFSGSPYAVNEYTFNTDVSTVIFNLGSIWSETMFTEANYSGIGIYLTREVAGRQITTQLLKDVDYDVSTTSPTVTVNYSILPGDIITVKQYNQTYGTYCPYTPSKMGLYQIYVPGVVLNSTYLTPTYFILGHDGSYTKLYGNYDPSTGILDDYRDIALLEFETRVYNNYKVSSSVPITGDLVIPGEFRTTDYTRNEILEMYSTQFLNWVGANRIDYKTQTYRSSNKFTYNYNDSSNKVTSTQIQQGYWRGISNWLYDTDNPADAPWEMLGFVVKPLWWDDRYGIAPYTSTNTYMWEEIASGFVWNNGESYINPRKIRPYLLSLLPVNSLGELISPFESVVGNYNSLTFNRDWKIGDGAPAEASYIKSSVWPFDLMRLLALTKPAQFFNLFADIDRYKYNDTLLIDGQYLYDSRYHLDPRQLEVYGNGVAKHSYINWAVDYVNQFGEDGTNVITNFLKNIDVRLTYNMAGFTAKNYLKFLVEKATPVSKNTSLLIPDENYTVMLYDNPPEETIIYSSVIIQKSSNGWIISGNGKNKQYFTTLIAKPSKFRDISTDTQTIRISNDWYSDRTAIVPYGTVFYSTQALAEFLNNYGAYLSKQGVVFDTIVYGVEMNWTRMIQEYLVWADQSWEVGSIISINPNARKFTVARDGLVPQPLTIQQENFVLNQNLLPLNIGDMCIDRENEKLEISILTESDTVAYSNISLNSIEHAIVFDNVTSFNDIIYNLESGLRQQRLLLQGYKTANWNGYINASGFILNEDNIREWQPNKKYPKNIIVTNKSKYYTSIKLIEPSNQFRNEDWIEIDYDTIKTGLLPNPSTNSYESAYYYDTNRANLENDADLLAFSLIGFRPREYLAAVDLSDITQINVYKNIIKSKGTNLLAEGFKGANFDQGAVDYVIQENWAIKRGDFGNVINTNFVEVQLSQSLLAGNPTIVAFAESDVPVDGAQQTVPISNIINYERVPTSANFLPVYTKDYTLETGLPSAGYVNVNDSDITAYTFNSLNNNNAIAVLRRNSSVWIANYNGGWDIFKAASLNNNIVAAENNLNGSVTLTFANIHNLSKNDLIAIKDFDYRVEGFFTVTETPSIYTIKISLSLDASVRTIESSGIGFQLISNRYEQPSDAVNDLDSYSAWTLNRAWIDHAENNQWAVYASDLMYKQKTTVQGTSGVGTSVTYSEYFGTLIADGNGNIQRYDGNVLLQTLVGGSGSTSDIVISNDRIIGSDPNNGLIRIYAKNTITDNIYVESTINALTNLSSLAGPIAVSDDKEWLYVSDVDASQIAIYKWNTLTLNYVFVDVFSDSIGSGTGWGMSIATSIDGTKLIIGAPLTEVGGLTNAGAVFVYQRNNESFYCNGTQTSFTLANQAPNAIADIYVNDELITSGFTITNVGIQTVITFITAPLNGSVLIVEAGYVNRIAYIESPNVCQNGNFGFSVDTNRYGADILIGAPYEIYQENDIGIEGAVHRFTNSGQRYGSITTTISGSHTGSIFIDGYKVTYSGTIDVIRDAINTQTPSNIIASSDGNVLTITTREDTLDTLYNVIDLIGEESTLADLGISLYQNTQTMRDLNKSDVSAFGYNVKMNERDSAVISAISSNRYSPTTFDYTPDTKENDTVFDSDTTIFVDSFDDQGSVYMFDYLPAWNENIDNPGKYAFGQYVNTEIADSPDFSYGKSLSYSENIVICGTSSWTDASGGFTTFTTDWERTYESQQIKTSSWFVEKTPLTIVDINDIGNISLYDTQFNQTLDTLDYIDPLQGKLFGAILTNLDYTTYSDPAIYNESSVSWHGEHVGKTWLNLNTIRMLNYHQPDLQYNAKNWGRAFPGSTADVLTWIESDTSPVNYSGIGYPNAIDKYTTTTVFDRSSNSLVVKYYFWVKNYNAIPEGKTLSPNVIGTYLLNPIDSGISFLAPITTNAIALYNSGSNIQSNSTALHIGFGISGSVDSKHTSWDLIRDDNASDFLSGLPQIPGQNPAGQYLKYIESFAGFDGRANEVPDPALPTLVKYGTSFRPRQSMFINRNTAIEVYVKYANSILIQYPIVEMRDLNFLQKVGILYNVPEYWTYVNWWDSGYNNTTKPNIEVENFNYLLTLNSDELLTGVDGENYMLINGLIAKVTTNRYGNSEYYVYEDTYPDKWRRIGAENSTIQILSLLYTPFGWSSDKWGNVWDKTQADEIYWIIRWLNEQCYIDELAIERNRSLILMFKYIQSESLQQNNYLPWLNKTSLIDVKHKIRDLLPYRKYQKDNQEFLEGFLNEIKPYHVYVKDFVFSYNGYDEYNGIISDFDVPASFNPVSRKYESPKLVYGSMLNSDEYNTSSEIWNNQKYSSWFNNYGLAVSTENTYVSVAELIDSLSAIATTCTVTETTGLPFNGLIKINDEIISYSDIDFLTNTLTGLIRGVNDTTPTIHASGAVIEWQSTPIIVYSGGRGYLEPPKISAYIDTTMYPAPRVEAQFTPVMSNDVLIGVSVDNPGSGYAVIPELIIQASSISESFDSANINSITNQITIVGHAFVDGDCVKYETPSGGVTPTGLIDGGLYYVNVIDPNTICLFESYKNAMLNSTDPYAHINGVVIAGSGIIDVDGRVRFINQGSGLGHTLTISARIGINTTEQPVREGKIQIKFDRVSYTIDEGEGTAAGRIAEYYAPTLSMPGVDITQLMDDVTYPNATILGANFAVGWDETPWSLSLWDESIQNPVVDVELIAPEFTDVTDYTYAVFGGYFESGYGPEELIAGYITDEVVITVTSDDLSPSWNHTITIDRFGNMAVSNNSLTEETAIYNTYWWYGIPGNDPSTDPLANTTMSVNTGPVATFLRS